MLEISGNSSNSNLVHIIALSLILSGPLSFAFAAETIIVNVVVNSVSKGELFVIKADGGDFLFKADDLKTLGITAPLGRTSEISGELYFSLRSLAGVSFRFDENTLSLELTVSPSLLPQQIISMASEMRSDSYYPRDSGAFLNYRLDYNAGNTFDFQTFNAYNELGVRSGDILFLSDSTFTKDMSGERFVRLMSSAVYDRRHEMQRLVIGDALASSGALGSGVNIGGVSFSKVYRMQPNFITYPSVSFGGTATTPSEADIYINGNKVRTEKLAPGGFTLNDIIAYGGAGSVDVVIRDVFGREQRIIRPFYFTDALLNKGLHDYSYNVGFIRENFGTVGNDYGPLAVSAFHRYGLSDSLTLGASGEGKKGLYNLASQASYLIDNAGVLTLAMAGSVHEGKGCGGAGAIGYSYNGKMFSFGFLANGFTNNYEILASEFTTDKEKLNISANVGYTMRGIGSFSIGYLMDRKYQGTDQDAFSMSYTKNLTSKLALNASFRTVRQKGYASDFLVGLTYYPGKDVTVFGSVEKGKDTEIENIQVVKSPPFGEGVSYRASLSRSVAQDQQFYSFTPYIQYNGRYGIYSGEFDAESINGRIIKASRFSTAGAIVYVGSTVGLTRPVSDSFGLVRVGDLEGVTIYQSSQEIGRTDSEGKLFIPNLNSYYDNQVSINDKDIPMNYELTALRKFISPSYRSGSCITFPIKRLQPIIGKLVANIDGEAKPLEFCEATMAINGTQVSFPTGQGGEFYLDDTMWETGNKPSPADGCKPVASGAQAQTKTGMYRAEITYQGKCYPFTIVIPKSEEIIVDLGRVVVGAPAEPEKGPPMRNEPAREK